MRQWIDAKLSKSFKLPAAFYASIRSLTWKPMPSNAALTICAVYFTSLNAENLSTCVHVRIDPTLVNPHPCMIDHLRLKYFF
jgi:hypothetical protein